MPQTSNTLPAIDKMSVPMLVGSMRHRMDRLLYGLTPLQIKIIRRKTNLSQTQFAQRFGLSARTLEQWESGRRSPDRAAVTLLKVIAHDPTSVDAALMESPDAATVMKTALQDRSRSKESDPFPALDPGAMGQRWSVRW